MQLSVVVSVESRLFVYNSLTDTQRIQIEDRIHTDSGEEKWENICTVTYIFGERREFSKSFFFCSPMLLTSTSGLGWGRGQKLNFNFVHCTHRYFPFWDHNQIPSRPDRTNRCSRTCWPSRSTPNRWRCQHCSSKRQISRYS